MLQQFVAALLSRRMPCEEFDEAVKAQFDRDLDRRASDGPWHAERAARPDPVFNFVEAARGT